MIENVCRSSRRVPVILVLFWIKFYYFDRFLKNIQNIKFLANPSSGSRVVPCGPTDGQSSES